MTPDTNGRRTGEPSDMDCDELAGGVGAEACDKVLVEICRANKLGVTITIWDLPQVTGLPLYAAFAAVRTLEFGRLVSVGDNLSDPFGATLHVESTAAERLRNIRAA